MMMPNESLVVGSEIAHFEITKSSYQVPIARDGVPFVSERCVIVE
jgi:hypothetical protein